MYQKSVALWDWDDSAVRCNLAGTALLPGCVAGDSDPIKDNVGNSAVRQPFAAQSAHLADRGTCASLGRHGNVPQRDSAHCWGGARICRRQVRCVLQRQLDPCFRCAGQVLEQNILHPTPSSAVRFDAHSQICTVQVRVPDGDVADPAAGFAPDADAVAFQEVVVFGEHVLR